jgi:hypothetical protein
MAGIYDRSGRSEFDIARQEYRAIVKEDKSCYLALMFPIFWDEMLRIKKLCYSKVNHGTR